MDAKIGDRLHVHSNTVGARDRVAEIIEVRARGRPALPGPLPGRPREPGLPRPRLRDRAGRAVDNPRVDLAALRTPAGEAALAAAARVAGGDPLAAAPALRAAGVPPALAAAALTQAALRRRAVGKFGPAAAGMFFTRAGLEQATRAGRGRAPGGPAVRGGRAHARRPRVRARRRRDRLPPAPGSGCTGWRRTRRPRRWPRRTRPRAGSPTGSRSTCGDATVLRPVHAWTRCSATRPGAPPAPGGGCSTRRPTPRRGTSSPGSPARVPYTVLKVAPGFDPRWCPPGAEVEMGRASTGRSSRPRCGAARWPGCRAGRP